MMLMIHSGFTGVNVSVNGSDSKWGLEEEERFNTHFQPFVVNGGGSP